MRNSVTPVAVRKRWQRWGLLGCGGCLSCLLCVICTCWICVMTVLISGAVYQDTCEFRDSIRYPPPGDLVDVEGYKMHLYCIGEGSPTVVMDAGLGGWSQDWVWVQPEVAKFTRACTYDRAGLGWSEPRPGTRDSQQVVSQLHTLLVNAGESGPYVLVGHSFGGLNVRLYAMQYSDQVAGVVLVDATPEDLYDAYPADMLDEQREVDAILIFVFRVVKVLARYGGMRLLVHLAGTEPLTFLEDYPPEVGDQILALAFYSPQYYETSIDESLAFEESMRQVQSAGQDPELPYVVMVRNPEGVAVGLEEEEIWYRLHVELAERLPNATLVVTEQSDHSIQVSEPALVTDAIRQVVEEVRAD